MSVIGCAEHVTLLSTFLPPSLQIPDYLSLDQLASSVSSILIVGGGFLGTELAVGLVSRGEREGEREGEGVGATITVFAN